MAGGSTEGLDPETFCLWMLSFVSQKMELSKAHTGAYSLDMGNGNCYFRSLAFCALCKRLGLPARPVALLDPGRSHVVSEVYYADEWHQFDPTYGSIFYSRPTYDGTGVILSARQLRTEPTAMDFCMRVNAEIWSATYVPTIEMIPMIPE
jgi:hypothetical protein